MRKKTAVSLAVATILGTASVTFAAPNPFSDVPADHWAYDAVAQLVADGVITGYGDDTFRGDRQVTRYELAQVIAKVLAQDAATANDPAGTKRTLRKSTDKALVDRLVAEFGDELNTLGVRVSNLERNADLVKWTGELRYIYKSDRNENRAKNNLNRLEVRLFPSAEINDHWHIKSRLTSRVNLKNDTANDVALTYIYAEGKYKNFGINLGKLSNYSTNDDGLVTDDYFSGAQLNFGKKLKAVLEAGRWNMTRGNGVGSLFAANADTADYLGAQLNYANGKLTSGLGYRYFKTDGLKTVAGYSTGGDEDKANIMSVGATYKFDNNFALGGAYAKNTKADNADTSHSIKLSYKGAKRGAAGTWGMHAAYRYVSRFVSLAPTYESMFSENHRKGYEVGLQYVPVRNVLTDICYFDGKKLDTGNNSNTLYGRVRFYF